MRTGQKFTMGDTGMAIDGNVKVGGLNNGSLWFKYYKYCCYSC
jgi:hypothetical protein